MTEPTREEILEQVARDLLDALQTLVGDKHPGLLFSDRMITARKAIDDAKVKL